MQPFDPIIGAYVPTSCAVLLLYDFLCTLHEEVAYVWGSPWSLGTILFVVNRYLPFVDTIMIVNLRNTAIITPETCHTHFKIIMWTITIGIMLSELILMLRTYAIWDRKRHILIFFSVLAAFTFGAAYGSVYMMTESLEFIPVVPPRSGCHLHRVSRVAIVPYILILFSETAIVVLTMIKASQHLRRSNSPWVFQLYKDGLLFYLYLLGITIVNVISPLVLNAEDKNIFALPQHVFHSIFCNRVILLILRQRRQSGTSILLPHGQNAQKPDMTSIILSSILNTHPAHNNNEELDMSEPTY